MVSRRLDEKLEIALSPEMKLLLLCSINEPTENEYKKIRELILSEPDWNIFNKLVIKHRVYPAVYKNLKKIQDCAIGSEIVAALGTRSKHNRTRAMRQTLELIRLMELFEKSDVRAVSVKGPILGLLTCGDATARTSKDLDILVCPSELEKAEKVLQSEGYVKNDATDGLTAKQRLVILKAQYHFSYLNRKNGINIELHWRIYRETYHFNFEEIWANKAVVDLNGRKINVLGSEENLLYLIFHGSMHAWMRLKWLCDVYELLKKGGIDWGRIAERAKKLGIEHLLGQTLLLTNLLYQTELHKEILDAKTYRYAVRLAESALSFICSADDNTDAFGRSNYLSGQKYMMAWNKGLKRKLSSIFVRFYPIESDFNALKLKDQYFFIYYIVRLLSRFGRVLKAVGKGDKKA